MSFYATDNYARLAEVVSDATSPTGMEAPQLLTPHAGDMFRATGLSAGASAFNIDVTLPDTVTAHYFYLDRPRQSYRFERDNGAVLAASDTISVTWYADEIGGVEVDSAPPAPCGMALGLGVWGLWREAGVAFRAMRMTIDAPSRASAPDNNVDLGRLHFGPAFVFKPGYLRRRDSVDSSTRTTRPAAGARLMRKSGEMWRVWSLFFRTLRNIDARGEIRRFMNQTYDAEAFVFGMDEENPATDWMLASHLNPDLDALSRNFSSLSLELQEHR